MSDPKLTLEDVARLRRRWVDVAEPYEKNEPTWHALCDAAALALRLRAMAVRRPGAAQPWLVSVEDAIEVCEREQEREQHGAPPGRGTPR